MFEQAPGDKKAGPWFNTTIKRMSYSTFNFLYIFIQMSLFWRKSQD